MDKVSDDVTFDSDDNYFHRKEFARKAMELVRNHQSDQGACVIDIDAPWGMGKTTLLRMWMNELDKAGNAEARVEDAFNLPNHCIYYNAWENDHYSDALTPMIYTLCGRLYVQSSKNGAWESKYKEKAQAILSAAVGMIASYGCYNSTGNSVLASSVGGIATKGTDIVLHLLDRKDVEELGKSYQREIAERKTFRDALSSLADACGRLFIFIDELDRCKPLFAIQTLESIKHYFNIHNVVFVFATDNIQLAHTIEGVYGPGIDAGGYLLKFFDYMMYLPTPNIRDLMAYAYPDISVDEAFYSFFNDIRKLFTITPREIPWIVKRTKMIWDTMLGVNSWVNRSLSFSFIAFFVAMKTKLPTRYTGWLIGNDQLSDILSKEESSIIGSCVRIVEKYKRMKTSELEKEIIAINESHNASLYNNEKRNTVDLTKLFVYIIDVLCAPQMKPSQTVGEALFEALELC